MTITLPSCPRTHILKKRLGWPAARGRSFVASRASKGASGWPLESSRNVRPGLLISPRSLLPRLGSDRHTTTAMEFVEGNSWTHRNFLGARDATVAIRGLRDLSNLSLGQLYAVYVGVAKADWNWRRRAAHGSVEPPPGHSGFRPLPFAVFEHRVQAAQTLAHGD